MEIGESREVIFGDYCASCEYQNNPVATKSDTEEFSFSDLGKSKYDNNPCDDCLDHPATIFSKIPVRYKKKE